MEIERQISEHYRHGDLLRAIQSGLTALGKTPETVTVRDLGPVDEFHIGGREATQHFLDQLGLTPDMKLLDIGCGLGGPARFAASKYGAHISGIDLSDEYVTTGKVLNQWVGLSDQIELQQASALSMPFPASQFDGAYMMHVGMNIEDKQTLFREVFRVLKPGARFGLYDIMRREAGDLAFPVPWARSESTSWLAEPKAYEKALSVVGFEIGSINDRYAFAMDFFAKVRLANQTQGGRPPLGLHTLMQASTPTKITNMVANLSAGLIAPVEIFAVKR